MSHTPIRALQPENLNLSHVQKQVPHLAVIGISGLATGVADLTADESLLEMLVEIVLHAPEAALHGNTAEINIAPNLLIHIWDRDSGSVDNDIHTQDDNRDQKLFQ